MSQLIWTHISFPSFSCFLLNISKKENHEQWWYRFPSRTRTKIDSWNDKLLILIDYAGGVISWGARYASSISCETNPQAQHGWKTTVSKPQIPEGGKTRHRKSHSKPTWPKNSNHEISWMDMVRKYQKISRRNKRTWKSYTWNFHFKWW